MQRTERESMWKASALLVVLGMALAAIRSGGQGPDLPPGPMQQKARTACLECHDANIIVQQRLDRKTWEKVVDKMIHWGAVVEPRDRTALVDYFSSQYGPKVPLPAKARARVHSQDERGSARKPVVLP